MCYASGNHDDDVFRSPEVFDIGRKPNDHPSFGYGTHFCLGAGLARLEIRILLEPIMQWRLHLESRCEIRRACLNLQNLIKVMPVAVCAG
jgi:cholest-4-en-3-one 26-monooxygenase